MRQGKGRLMDGANKRVREHSKIKLAYSLKLNIELEILSFWKMNDYFEINHQLFFIHSFFRVYVRSNIS